MGKLEWMSHHYRSIVCFGYLANRQGISRSVECLARERLFDQAARTEDPGLVLLYKLELSKSLIYIYIYLLQKEREPGLLDCQVQSSLIIL